MTTPDLDRPPTTPRRVLTTVMAALVVVVAILVMLFVRIGDDDATPSNTTTNAPPATVTRPPSTATSTEPATTTVTTTPATTEPGAHPLDTAIWPPPIAEPMNDPVAAARAFAVDLVGFTDPILGDFAAGDSRSGEVEVRAKSTGPVTTVVVRQLDDAGHWWVIGASTADIEVDQPSALAAIASPLRLTGRARAFEGTVRVDVLQDGSSQPLGTGVVMGRGDGVLGPFDGRVEFTPPSSSYGTVLFTVASAEDGRVWQAGAVRVRFGPD